jgi:hypothetical protein
MGDADPIGLVWYVCGRFEKVKVRHEHELSMDMNDHGKDESGKASL